MPLATRNGEDTKARRCGGRGIVENIASGANAAGKGGNVLMANINWVGAMKKRITSGNANGFTGETANPPTTGKVRRRKILEYESGKTSPVVAEVLQEGVQIPRRNSPEDLIVIPPVARTWELSAFPLASRLAHILGGRGCRRLGDLHGLRLSEILKWRNVGKATVRELMAFIKTVQQDDWNQQFAPDGKSAANDYEI